jgi:chemotaxis protein CheX
MGEALTLESVLDLKAAEPLKAALLARRGETLTLDASEVQRLGGQCLQVLLAARRSWSEDDRPFAIAPRSPAFDEALALFGATGRFDRDGSGEAK